MGVCNALYYKRLALAGLALALAGCVALPRYVTAPGVDPVAALLAHPQARSVARDYPEFFTAALNTTAALKHDLTLAQNQP